MHSEPAASPWAVDLASDPTRPTPPSASSPTTALASDLPATTRRHLSLIIADAPEERLAPPAADRPAMRHTDDIVVPAMAEPATTMASALWASPAAVLDLLSAASEHRRALDLVRTACEIGAIQMPPALVEILDRARATWPASLPYS